MSASTLFSNAQRIISQILQWTQTSGQNKTANLITDTFTSGIDNATTLGEGFTIVPGTNNTISTPTINITTGGIAYDVNSNRIFISPSDTTLYNSTNPSITTNDGTGTFISTPQSTGVVNIPVTQTSQNYVWVDYLATIDTTAFTLNEITNAKIFYKQTNGYRVTVTTVNTPPDASSIFLGNVNMLGGGAVAPSNISQLNRTYYQIFPNIIPLTTIFRASHLFSYRRPNLVYNSPTVVNIERGLTGVSGQAAILFSDGNYRTDSTLSHINLDVSRTAVLSGSAQSGVFSGVAINGTWYAVYAVKVTDSATDFVAVASTELPTQASFPNLNTNFGVNGWEYLGLIVYGDSGANPNAIVLFVQDGNFTLFRNANFGNESTSRIRGIQMASASTSWTSLSYSYSSGIGSGQIPSIIGNVLWAFHTTSGSPGVSGQFNITSGVNFSLTYKTIQILSGFAGQVVVDDTWGAAVDGLQMQWDSAGTPPTKADIMLGGFIDNSLGVGPNPLL